MSVQILNRPYDGITPKLLPVYNGIAFTLDSPMKTRPNFRYIAEIFIDNNKVSELRHHPDIAHNNIGVFEVGRIVENFVGYDNPIQNNATTWSGSKTNRRFYVSFGEEYSSANPIGAIVPTDATSFRINTGNTEAFSSWNNGSYVLIGGSNVPSYNGWGRIFSTTATSAVITGLGTKTTTPDYSNMYYYLGYSSANVPGNPWGYTTINGTNYLTLKIYNGNLDGDAGLDRIRLYVGNTVNIKQSGVAGQNFYENMDFRIIAKETTLFIGQKCVKLTFDAPYAGVMPNGVIGTVITKDNVIQKAQVTTKQDLTYAFNGALQYQEWLDWNPSSYIWSNTSSKFLTKRPDSLKNINVCSDEHWTLSTFGLEQNTLKTAKIQTETWSTTLPYTANGTVTKGVITGAGSTEYCRITLSNASAASYAIGDYATINDGTTSAYGQVAQKSASGFAQTIVTINVPRSSTLTPTGTITRNIAVKYWNAPVQTASTIMACGPKNFIQSGLYPEFTNGSCYKYFVRTIIPITAGLLTPWNYNSLSKSETWTFNITCDCSTKTKYKLMWLNELGGWDFYTFDLGSNKSLVIEKSIYQKKLKEAKTTGGNRYTYSQGERGRTTYDTKSTLNYVVRSNFLTQEKIEWLSWIYESPEVYWIDEAKNKLHPIVLKATDVDIPNKQNAGEAGHLYIYTIEFETAYDRVVQRGGDIKYTQQQITMPDIGTGTWTYTKSLYE